MKIEIETLNIHHNSDHNKQLRALAEMLITIAGGKSVAPQEKEPPMVWAQVNKEQERDFDDELMAAVAEAAAEIDETPVTADSTSVPAPPPAGELDAAGVAYDPELHSSSKATNADGTWRKRRVDNRSALPVPPPPPAAAPVLVPPPPAPAKVYPTGVADLLPLITSALGAKRITMDLVVAACQELGITGGLPGLGAHADKIPALCDSLGLL
jgi:hypothetical protein